VKITDIKQQVKRQDRFAIYIDGKYALSFGQAEIMKLGLHIGDEFTKAELADLKKRAGEDKALDNAYRYIALRPRSQWELETYLKRKGVDEVATRNILNKLSESGLVDDEAFARAWVNNRRLLKSVSQRRLIQELRAKRVDSAVIDKVLAEDEVSDLDSLKQLVAKKRDRYKDDQKFMQYLARQGYNYSDIKQALETPELD
jgi:regulatory protein